MGRRDFPPNLPFSPNEESFSRRSSRFSRLFMANTPSRVENDTSYSLNTKQFDARLFDT
jgi:hypothetical protein